MVSSRSRFEGFVGCFKVEAIEGQVIGRVIGRVIGSISRSRSRSRSRARVGSSSRSRF